MSKPMYQINVNEVGVICILSSLKLMEQFILHDIKESNSVKDIHAMASSLEVCRDMLTIFESLKEDIDLYKAKNN